MEKKRGIIDAALLIASLVLLLGTKLVFHACEVMEGEMVMSCHWAENAVAGVAAVLVCQSVIMLAFATEEARRWLSVAMLSTAALEIFIPGVLIELCMMDSMRCRSIMRPSVTIISVIIIVLAGCNILRAGKK